MTPDRKRRPTTGGGVPTTGLASRPDRTARLLEVSCRLRVIRELSSGRYDPEVTEAEVLWTVTRLAEWAALHLSVVLEHEAA